MFVCLSIRFNSLGKCFQIKRTGLLGICIIYLPHTGPHPSITCIRSIQIYCQLVWHRSRHSEAEIHVTHSWHCSESNENVALTARTRVNSANWFDFMHEDALKCVGVYNGFWLQVNVVLAACARVSVVWTGLLWMLRNNKRKCDEMSKSMKYTQMWSDIVHWSLSLLCVLFAVSMFAVWIDCVLPVKSVERIRLDGFVYVCVCWLAAWMLVQIQKAL